MRSSHGVGVSLAMAALLGACASGGQPGAQPSGGTAATVAPAPSGRALSARFFGSLPGEVRVVPGASANQTHVSLSVRGGSSGQAMAWQIKRGLCSNQNEAVEIGRRGAYPTLLVRGDGMASFSGSLNVSFPDGAPHFVVVTASRSNDGVLACADLRPGNN